MDPKPTPPPKPDEFVVRPVARRELAEKTDIQADHANQVSNSPPPFCGCSEHANVPPFC